MLVFTLRRTRRVIAAVMSKLQKQAVTFQTIGQFTLMLRKLKYFGKKAYCERKIWMFDINNHGYLWSSVEKYFYLLNRSKKFHLPESNLCHRNISNRLSNPKALWIQDTQDYTLIFYPRFQIPSQPNKLIAHNIN